MAEPAFGYTNSDELQTCIYDPRKIEMASLENMLDFIIKLLQKEMDTVMGYLGAYTEIDDYISQVIKMVNTMELLQMNFVFIREGLATKSEEEFQALKQKFSLIKDYYHKANSKEDFTSLPAKYVIAILHDKAVLEYRRVMENCFKTNSHGDTVLVKNEENLARIKIITGRFDLLQSHFASVIVFPKDDIFCFERSSPIWQDLYKSATFKEIVSKKEVEESSQRFNFFLYFSHLIIKNRINNKTIAYPKAVFSLCQDVLYYGIQQAKVETQALLYLLNPNVEEVFRAWNLAENRWVSKYHLAHLPSVQYDELIYVPKLFPAITKEVIFKDYEDNTYNKLCPMDLSQFENIDPGYKNREFTTEELFIQQPNTVPIRILSYDHLNLKKSDVSILHGIIQKAKNVIRGSDSAAIVDDREDAIVVHIHGGGFVATSSATHKVYLTKWVKSLKLIHFSIDYRLAPVNKYPDALDDVWQAYLWIVNFANTVLGIKNKKIILVGDSAGGNLALALMLRLVRAGLQPPHGCVLIYPALYVDSNSFSPSYFESLDDPMLPYTILKLVVKAYVGQGFKNLEDPFISPILASPELLEKLPPIRIITGSKDPLHDDTWRFLYKLKKLDKNVRMIVHSHLSHGFLCHKELKNHDLFAEEVCELIREVMALNV